MIDFETVGEDPEDHGWQTEWQITEGFRYKNGTETNRQYVALASCQGAAALSARVHFITFLQHRPIGRG